MTRHTRFRLGMLLAVTGAWGAAVAAAPAASGTAPTGLLCDLLARPELTEIANPRPRFSWIVDTASERQTAYRIRVAESATGLSAPGGSLWDSGRVTSDRSVAVPYAGPALAPRHDYWWQVQTWDRRERAGLWSQPQHLRTGDLREFTQASGEDRIPVSRYSIEQTAVAPVRVVTVEPGHLFLDFGRDAFAGLRIRLSGAYGGRKLTVHLGETLDAANHVSRKPGGSIRYLRSDVDLQDGDHSYTVSLGPKDARRMSPQVGPVMPFRYVELENCPAALDAGSVRQLAAHYRWDESASAFHCSDPQLNAVWDLCKYSMKATSYAGVYVDGDRERLPYEADAYINQLGHYCTDREYTLARYSLGYLLLHPTWPTEWILFAHPMAWSDYLYTGDPATIETFYRELERRSLKELERSDGLISTVQPAVSRAVLASLSAPPIRDIVDWPVAERDGFEMRPVNTVVNAFHWQSLARMGDIAAALGRHEEAAAWRKQAERTARSFHEKLYDPSTGLYVDGEGSRHSSLHANLFPLAFGLVPPERIPKVAEFVRSRGMACSVYGAQFLLEALYRSGGAEQARKLMTAPGDRSWRHMVEDVGTTITLEAWDNRYKPNQDWNHAWGAAPANIIPRWLMGIRPLEPGFRKMVIAPQPGGLAQASLDLPTIRGTVHEEFRATPERFTLTVRIPANSLARVLVPRLGRGEVTVDGKRAKAAADGDTLTIDPIASGEHVIISQ